MADVSKIRLPDSTVVNLKDYRIPGVDTEPTSGSSNIVTSGGVYQMIVDDEQVTSAALNDLNNRLGNIEENIVDDTYIGPLETSCDDNENSTSMYKNILSQRKVYTGVLGVANGTAPNNNSYANQSFYFITIHPKSWDAQWSVKYRINVHLDDETQNYKSSASASVVNVGSAERGIYDCNINGTAGVYNTFHFFQSQKNTSYRPIYYHMLHTTTQAGFDAGYGHKLGVSLVSSYLPTPATDYSSGSKVTNVKYSRTIEVILEETVNCSAELMDFLEVEGDAYRTDYHKLDTTYYTTNTSASNSAGRWNNLSATTQGLYESSDDNTYTYTQQTYNYLTNGSKNEDVSIRILGYGLIGFNSEGKALCISVYNSTQSSYTTSISQKGTRLYCTEGFDYTKGIRYLNTSTTFSADAAVNISPALNYSSLDFRYTDNCVASGSANSLGLVNRKPVYLRGTIGSDGLFYLAPIDVTYNNATYQRAWTQDIPSIENENGEYVYWFIGYPYNNSSYPNSLYQLNLLSRGELVWYKNGNICPYTTSKANVTDLVWESGTGTKSVKTKGTGCTANGVYSVAEGYNTSTDGAASHVEGYSTYVGCVGGHAEGTFTTAGEDDNTQATHAEGEYTLANGWASHAEGRQTMALGDHTHVEGILTRAVGDKSHAENGNQWHCISTISGNANATSYSCTFNKTDDTLIYDLYGFLGSTAFSELIKNSFIVKSGNVNSQTHTFKITDVSNITLNSNILSLTITLNKTLSTSALSNDTTYELNFCGTFGDYSHSENGSTAFGKNSHSEGVSASIGEAAHSEGWYTYTLNDSEHAQGNMNLSNKASDTFGNAGNTIHSVGIGNSISNRKNAEEIMQNGDMYLIGVGSYDGKNYSSATTVQDVINGKQATLVSGTNIKTINNTSLLGSGNINTPNTQVTQTVTSSTNTSYRPVLLGYSYSDATTFAPATTTNTVYATHLAKFAPSTGKLAVVGLNKMTTSGTMATGSNNDVWNTNGETTTIATVATSGSYNDLTNKPTIPTVNNTTITVKMNGSTVDSFTTNASSAKTIDLGTVITSHQDVSDKEIISNKVTSISSSSTDTQYPSAKCMYDIIAETEEAAAAAINDLNDRLIDVEDGSITSVTFNGTPATVTNGTAAITATIPSAVTETTVSGWGFTKNTGTLTGVTFNGSSATVTSGVAAITATIPTVPTISTDIVSDKASDAKTASPKAVYNEIHPAKGSSQPNGGFVANTMYVLGTITGSVTFSLATPSDSNIVNHYYWTFDTSTTAPTITWPSGLSWYGGSAPTISASKHYEISVLNNIAISMEV